MLQRLEPGFGEGEGDGAWEGSAR
ncbi:hypothetical protein CGRA01v4_09108 [Colletotrichum graminicola]|nr:hypothetical protein CGRA01v4_09108 [Colletotrichum graminicola]